MMETIHHFQQHVLPPSCLSATAASPTEGEEGVALKAKNGVKIQFREIRPKKTSAEITLVSAGGKRNASPTS